MALYTVTSISAKQDCRKRWLSLKWTSNSGQHSCSCTV